jgi:AcrR family transcriptional regulator
MIYYYFPTKDDLFFAVVEEVYTALLADIERALEPGAEAKERLRRVFVRVGKVSELELATVRLVLREVLVSSTRLERIIDRFSRGHIPLVFAALLDGASNGEIDPKLDPGLLLMCTIAVGAVPQMMRRVASDRFSLGGVPGGEALSNLLIEVLFRGIGGKGEERIGNGAENPTERQ